MLLTHKDVLLKLEQLEKKILRQEEKGNKHEEEIQFVFQALKKLIEQPSPARKRIGFKID